MATMGRGLSAHKISRRSSAWFRLRAEIPQRTRLFVAYKLGNRVLVCVYVTGLWPWNLALEMAARWSASLTILATVGAVSSVGLVIQ